MVRVITILRFAKVLLIFCGSKTSYSLDSNASHLLYNSLFLKILRSAYFLFVNLKTHTFLQPELCVSGVYRNLR